jgi:sec-independent protein translocase protein TatB
MFEVGFSEIVMVALVALLVIGPEKLPKVARMTGFWLGKARSMAANLKAEVQAEFHAEEMRQLLEEQTKLKDLKQIMQEGENALLDLKDSTEKLSKPEKVSLDK